MTATEYPIDLTISQIVSSFTNARTPTTHGSTHVSTDAIPVATTSNPGLCPTGSGTGTKVLTDLIEWVDITSVLGFRPATYIGTSGSGADYECDGTADNVQIQQALDAVSSGTKIIFLKGNYSISSPISQTGKNIRLLGSGDVTFNISLSTADVPAFSFEGTTILTTTLSENASAGATSVTLTDVTGVAAGQLIALWNNVDWTATYAGLKTGELYEIKSVSGNVVTLSDPLIRSYTTAAASSAKIMGPVKISVENIKFVGEGASSDQIGLAFFRNKNSSVRNCEFYNNGIAGVAFYTSYNSSISDCTINNSELNGYGYGICIATACAKARIENSLIHNCRHAICVTSSMATNGVNRDIIVDGNNIYSSYTGAGGVDSHADTLNLIVTNNIFDSNLGYCVDSGAQQLLMVGNEIINGGGVSIRDSINPRLTYKICGNKINGGAIFVDTGANDYDMLDISDNYCTGGDYQAFLSNTGKAIKFLRICNNHLDNALHYGIRLNLPGLAESSTIDLSNNQISNTVSHAIMLLLNTTYAHAVKINNNQITNFNTGNGGDVGISLEQVQRASVCNNQIFDFNGYNGTAIKTRTGCDYNVLIGNVAYGMTGTKFSLTGSNNTDVNNISL